MRHWNDLEGVHPTPTGWTDLVAKRIPGRGEGREEGQKRGHRRRDKEARKMEP